MVAVRGLRKAKFVKDLARLESAVKVTDRKSAVKTNWLELLSGAMIVFKSGCPGCDPPIVQIVSPLSSYIIFLWSLQLGY